MPEKSWAEIIEDAESGFELIPPSTYEWQIVAANAGETSTGKPRIRTKCNVLSGPNAGKSAWKDLVFEAGNAGLMGIRVQELEALGINPSDYQGTLEQVVEQLAPALVNRTFKAPLTHRQWGGTTRNEIGIFQKLQSGASPTAPTAPAAAQEASPPTPPPPPSNDETPF